MGNRDSAITARCKCELSARIKRTSIYTQPDRNGIQNSAIAAVHEDHQFITAPQKEAVMFEVDGHSGSAFARRNLPSVRHLMFFDVDHSDIIFVLNIAIDTPRIWIGNCKLWFSGQWDCADHLVGMAVQNSRGRSTPIK